MAEKEALVGNASDEKQVVSAKDKEKSLKQRRLNAYCYLMNTPGGRELLYYIINELCHHDANDFNTNGSITNYSLGERNIGRIIKGEACEASIEQYHLMEKENWAFLKEEKKDERSKTR